MVKKLAGTVKVFDCYKVAVQSGILEVRHYDNTGKLFDHIKIAPDGKVTEVYTDEERFKKYNY